MQHNSAHRTDTESPRSCQVLWQNWSDEAFEQAHREDKLVLLDSGATWCHWCHVMDRRTYEHPDVVRLINETFVPVRIDRDERPDVDTYLQRTPALVRSRSGGGWPLTVVLTPGGDPLYKATYLPPTARGATVGLLDVLRELDRYWRDNRDTIDQAIEQLRQHMAFQAGELFVNAGQLSDRICEDLRDGLADSFDEAHGGFGSAPKFYHVAGLRLLLNDASRGGDVSWQMVDVTLCAMARGGVHDHVGGGFHRYSVDPQWRVPHFEKMAYDNAALLSLFADAWALTGRLEFRACARDTLDWIHRDLADGEGRGFYASQDADVGLEDDGDFFTWTLDEIRNALGDDADEAISLFALTPAGDVHNRPGRNVLRLSDVRRPAPGLLDRLRDARQRRTAPDIDRTVYADLNGMLIAAVLRAAARLDAPAKAQQAIRRLDALLEDLRDERGVFAHCRTEEGLKAIGLLSDQAWMLRALLAGFLYSGDVRYLEWTRPVVSYLLETLRAEDGAFLSIPTPADIDSPTAILPERSWEDAPCQSAPSVAAETLLDLADLLDEPEWEQAALRALQSTAAEVRPVFGLFLAGYGLAVERQLRGPRSAAVVGSGPLAEALLREARRSFVPGLMVFHLDPDEPTHEQMRHRLGYRLNGHSPAGLFVCGSGACLPPITDPTDVSLVLERLRRKA